MATRSNVWRKFVRSALAWSVLLGSIVASYVAVSIWQVERGSGAAASEADVASAGADVNPFASANGTHLIAFVITESDCGWSALPSTMEAVGSIREALRSAYGDSYAQVTVVGVALDRNLDAGLRFLADLGKGRLDGAFDQVSVGGSWLNEQVVQFVWRGGITQAAIPQVVVVERQVNTESYPATIGVQSDRLLVNPIGTAEITQWVREGLPLDYTPYRGPPTNDFAQ